MTHYKLAVSDQACLVSHIITFFQVIDQLAGEAGALITMRHSFAFDTIFYPAFTTVFGFAHIDVYKRQALRAGDRIILLCDENFASEAHLTLEHQCRMVRLEQEGR